MTETFLKIAGVPSSDIVKELTKKVSTKDFDIKTNLIVFPKRHDVDKGLIGIVDAQIFGIEKFRQILYDKFGKPPELYDRRESQQKLSDNKGYKTLLSHNKDVYRALFVVENPHVTIYTDADNKVFPYLHVRDNIIIADTEIVYIPRQK